MASIVHQVWINAPASRVYEGLATAVGLTRWWIRTYSVESPEGTILSHDPGPEHGEVHFRVLESVKDERVVWEVVSEHPKTSPMGAWKGTKIVFQIARRENPGPRLGVTSGVRKMTVLEFRHDGLDDKGEYFAYGNYAWAMILAALQKWCERA
jgi:uncharacterized protein YndB with AHSA1/START domain